MELSPTQQQQFDRLLAGAQQAAAHAYCPHSRFAVGAALLTAEGEVLAGCNVENASYGLTNCAERTALFSAIAAGHRPGSFQALLVYTPNAAQITPCGACRQVMLELLAADCPVFCVGNDPVRVRQWRVDELLPGAFTLP